MASYERKKFVKTMRSRKRRTRVLGQKESRAQVRKFKMIMARPDLFLKDIPKNEATDTTRNPEGTA